MDRYRILCEACGYPLEDLARDGRCPECGKPVAESEPDHRAGSPWQQRRSVRAWFQTSGMALRRPGKLFDSIAITRRGGTSLLALNAILAGFFVASPWVGTLIGDPLRRMERGTPLSMLAFVGVLAAEAAAVAGVVIVLTLIEYAGVRFWSARRGGRLTPEAAWQVCCHASIGWLLAGFLPFFGLAFWFFLAANFGVAPRGWVEYRGSVISVQTIAYASSYFGGVLTGLLIFESRVYTGVRRCKYAATKRDPEPATETVAARI